MMLSCQRDLFQLDEEVAYMNGAYMSPQLKSVAAAGVHALALKNAPNRITTDHFFDAVTRVKQEFARLVDAGDAQRVAFIPSASYGIATVAANLPLSAGQEILIAQDQFPSNVYSWMRVAEQADARVRIIGVADGPNKGQRWNEALLEAIGANTACVAISHVHWAEGVLFDMAALRARTYEVGAWLVVDGTQSVGALPFSVQEWPVDALVCAAYKWMMAPYGTALAWYGPAMDGGIPIEENWINRKDSHDFKNLVNYQPAYQPGAGRYCMGEQSNFVLLPMLETALQQLNAWQPARIQTYLEQLNAPWLEQLHQAGFSILPSTQRAHHLLGVGLPQGLSMETIQQAVTQAGVMVSFRGQSIRVAPNVYNHANDWQRLTDALLSTLL
ncbi:MAG: aminotransferase class V-fold PLP-dependent enzyme [Saprospiraceae bacterium]